MIDHSYIILYGLRIGGGREGVISYIMRDIRISRGEGGCLISFLDPAPMEN